MYTHSLSRELAKRHDVYIFTRICDEQAQEYEMSKRTVDGLNVYLINNTFHQCDSFEMYYANETIDEKFAHVLDEITPDVVHVQNLVFLSVGLIRAIAKRGIPIIFTLHDYWLMCPRWHILQKHLRPCEKVFTGGFDSECAECLGELLNIRKGAKQAYRFARRLLPSSALRRLKETYFSYARKVSDNSENVGKLKERSRGIKELLASISLFLAPSEYARNRFIEFGIPEEKIRLSRFGMDDNLFPDIQKTKPDTVFRFGFIGTLLPAKGVHVLISAFNGISDSQAELNIYGKLYAYSGFEDYLPYLKKIVKNKNIRFKGEIVHDDIAGVFREIDMLVIPSLWYENAPLVILEAFLSKTPVVASRIGGIPELIQDGVNGLLCNPADADDLRIKMRFAIENPAVVEKLKAGIPEVKSIEENAREIEEMYDTVVYKGVIF